MSLDVIRAALTEDGYTSPDNTVLCAEHFCHTVQNGWLVDYEGTPWEYMATWHPAGAGTRCAVCGKRLGWKQALNNVMGRGRV